MTEVPAADPGAPIRQMRGELVAAFEAVLDSGSYILGEQVRGFEREWSSFCGTEHAVGVSSGTDALALALRAVGVGPGDEVLVPAMTAVATWMAVAQIGAVPVGVDIETERGGMDPEAAAGALTRRTRAIVAVHLFGVPADIPGLAAIAGEAEVPLVEDAAQAHGARLGGRVAGALGSIAAFSFYPTKNLGAVGDAGAVTTSDPELADRVLLLREYGWRKREDAEIAGVNARLDELQAALLRVALRRLDGETARRRALAARYREALEGVSALEIPEAPPGTEPAWHQFAVRHPRRDALAAALAERGVRTAVHYAVPPPLQGAFSAGQSSPGFPVAEHHAATSLSLPMHAGLSDDDQRHVADAVATAARSL